MLSLYETAGSEALADIIREGTGLGGYFQHSFKEAFYSLFGAEIQIKATPQMIISLGN